MQHSLDLRDLILSCLNSLPALESLTDWCRTSADFFLLLPNLPPSLVTLNTCFSDTIQIPTVTRALSLVTLPNLKTFRFLYFSKADLETNNVGIQLLAWFRGKGVTVEYGFERRDLREERRKGAIGRKALYFDVGVIEKEKRRVEAGEVERKSVEVQYLRSVKWPRMLQAFFEDVAPIVDVNHGSHRLSLPPPPVSPHNLALRPSLFPPISTVSSTASIPTQTQIHIFDLSTNLQST
ncbi:hypothetical protein JCM5353_008694 [Sporobolomyces roseus]